MFDQWLIHDPSIIHISLVGGWATPLKNMSSSVGMIRNPIYGKMNSVPNQQQALFVSVNDVSPVIIHSYLHFPWNKPSMIGVFPCLFHHVPMIYHLNLPLNADVGEKSMEHPHQVDTTSTMQTPQPSWCAQLTESQGPLGAPLGPLLGLPPRGSSAASPSSSHRSASRGRPGRSEVQRKHARWCPPPGYKLVYTSHEL